MLWEYGVVQQTITCNISDVGLGPGRRRGRTRARLLLPAEGMASVGPACMAMGEWGSAPNTPSTSGQHRRDVDKTGSGWVWDSARLSQPTSNDLFVCYAMTHDRPEVMRAPCPPP